MSASAFPPSPDPTPAPRPRVLAIGLPGATSSAALLAAADLRAASVDEAIGALAGAAVDALLIDGCLLTAELSRLLEAAGPNLVPGRPVVLVLADGGRTTHVETRLIDHVDDFVSRERGDEALLARLRNALRVRAALVELQRKNAELETLYGRLESMARRMADELRLAANVQRGLLPPPLHQYGIELAHEFIPVREIGGDYLDVVPMGPNRLALALGDVMGKGVPAALLAAHLKSGLHAQLQAGEACPAEIVTRINRLFWEVTPKGLFASLFLAILDLERGILDFVNAGHDYPFVVRQDGQVEDLITGGTVLGLVETSGYLKGRLALAPGDVLVVYSDGVTDRENAKGEAFGLQHLKEAAGRSRRDTARIVLYSMLGEIQGFSEGVAAEDDLTLVVAKRV